MRIRVGRGIQEPAHASKMRSCARRRTPIRLERATAKNLSRQFGDHAVVYEIKFYMGNHGLINEGERRHSPNIWYE